MITKVVSMLTTGDRFVTPTFDARGYRNIELVVPTLDDNSVVYVEASRYPHEFNYPFWKGSSQTNKYADNNIVMEFRCDNGPSGAVTAEVCKVTGTTIANQGNPQTASAATIGLGGGIVFDGTGDAMDLASTSFPAGLSLPTTGDFSVEVVFVGTNASIAAGDTIICCRDGAAGVGWQMEFDANQYVDFHVDDTTETVLTGATDAATGAIVHVVASLTRAGNGVIYINSAADDTTAITTSPGNLMGGTAASTLLCIGGDAARTAGDCLYGTVYFARIYNKALTATEVLRNYNTLMNLGGQYGWNPIVDPQDGADLVVTASGSHPNQFDLSPFLPERHDYFLRAVCATEQTTTPVQNDFEWHYR